MARRLLAASLLLWHSAEATDPWEAKVLFSECQVPEGDGGLYERDRFSVPDVYESRELPMHDYAGGVLMVVNVAGF